MIGRQPHQMIRPQLQLVTVADHRCMKAIIYIRYLVKNYAKIVQMMDIGGCCDVGCNHRKKIQVR